MYAFGRVINNYEKNRLHIEGIFQHQYSWQYIQSIPFGPVKSYLLVFLLFLMLSLPLDSPLVCSCMVSHKGCPIFRYFRERNNAGKIQRVWIDKVST